MSADDLMRHGTHDFPILVRDAKQTAPHEKTEYIEAGSKGISESTCREGRHWPLACSRAGRNNYGAEYYQKYISKENY
jgi:hypothetical protein